MYDVIIYSLFLKHVYILVHFVDDVKVGCKVHAYVSNKHISHFVLIFCCPFSCCSHVHSLILCLLYYIAYISLNMFLELAI